MVYIKDRGSRDWKIKKKNKEEKEINQLKIKMESREMI